MTADSIPILSGRTAVVTGGGSGIGRAVVLALAARGAEVLIAGRRAEMLEAVAEEARALHGRRLTTLAVDVTDVGQVAALAERAEALGGADVLVNNAGVVVEGSFLDVPQAEFDRVVATNLRGTALCCRALGAPMVKRGRGKVINLASNLGLAALPGAASYCASKAAIINLTRVLAVEWSRAGVQVNAVAPGYVETEINANVRADAQLERRVLDKVPARRFGRAEEVAALVALLAGPEADFITGSCMVIDGGQLARA